MKGKVLRLAALALLLSLLLCVCVMVSGAEEIPQPKINVTKLTDNQKVADSYDVYNGSVFWLENEQLMSSINRFDMSTRQTTKILDGRALDNLDYEDSFIDDFSLYEGKIFLDVSQQEINGGIFDLEQGIDIHWLDDNVYAYEIDNDHLYPVLLVPYAQSKSERSLYSMRGYCTVSSNGQIIYIAKDSTGILTDGVLSVDENIIGITGLVASGDRLAYQKYGVGSCDACVYNLTSKTETQITSGQIVKDVEICDDCVVWSDNAHKIYAYNLSSQGQIDVIPGNTLDTLISLYNGSVVWSDSSDGNVYLYDLITREKIQVSKSGNTRRPVIYKDIVLWVSDTNVYGTSNLYMARIGSLDFDVNPEKIRISDNVEFNATKYMGVEKSDIVWEFGDGTTDVSGNTTVYHNFTKPGSYEVNLTKTDVGGSNEKVSKTANVTIPVVLVHGFRSTPGVWQEMSAALEDKVFPVWNFDYEDHNTADPRTISSELASFIEDNRNDLSYNGQKYEGKIDIVCHSMGAIVSRYYVEKENGGVYGKDVRQWIGIAPAHGGSASADMGGSATDLGIGLILAKWISCPALDQLETTSDSVTSLGPLSSTTKYWVIAGWNPTHALNFGHGLSATLAKGGDGKYYWTYSGDMIVATQQSYDPNMEFEAFPPSSGDLGGSPAYEFDHTHICRSPRVIAYVIDCLKNEDKHSSRQKPPEDTVVLSFFHQTVGGLLNTMEKLIEIPVSIVAPQSSNGGSVQLAPMSGGSAAVQAVSDSPEGELIVLLDWDDGDIDLKMISPSGAEYSSAVHPDGMWYTKEGNMINFIIANPEAGTWQAKLIPISYPGQDISYNLTYVMRTNGEGGQSVLPTANFSANISQGPAPLAVLFTDKSENATDIEWFINGTSSGSAASLEYLFETPGIYNVTLVAGNDNGTSSMEMDVNVTMQTTQIEKPIADFTAVNNKGSAPLTVLFNDTSINDPTSWTWDFGDRTDKSIEQNTTHIYTKPGKYTVTLTVNNMAGTDTKVVKKYVEVSKKYKGNRV